MIRQYIKLFLESDSSNEEKKKSFAEMLDDYIRFRSQSQNNKKPEEMPIKNDPGNILNPDDIGFYRKTKKKY